VKVNKSNNGSPIISQFGYIGLKNKNGDIFWIEEMGDNIEIVFNGNVVFSSIIGKQIVKSSGTYKIVRINENQK